MNEYIEKFFGKMKDLGRSLSGAAHAMGLLKEQLKIIEREERMAPYRVKRNAKRRREKREQRRLRQLSRHPKTGVKIKS